MNANNATTNAQTMNAPRTVYIYCFGRRMSTVHYDDMDKIRAYMKKKATQGFTIINVCIKKICAFVDIAPTNDHISATPGYQRIKHAWRNIEGKMVETYDLYKPIVCSAYGWHYDSVAWAFVHTPITASVQYDAPIGPEPIQATESEPINAVEECANICPTAIDAVKVAMTLDAPISIRTGIKSFEIVPNGNGSASGRIIYHGTYAHGGIDLGTLNAVDIREHGVALQYIEEDGTPDEFFIQAVTIQSITALNTGRDIFVRGAN